MATKTSKQPSIKDYEQIGRTIENVYEANYANRKQIYLMSFVKGVAAGFGGVIGATIVVALLLWLLTLVETVPFLEDASNKVQDAISSQDKQ